MSTPVLEPFELELLGDRYERRYRRMRPEVEQMPWGTLDVSGFRPEVVEAARRAWTLAAFQEHRTGVAVSATLRALIEARAPLDLIALATRFPLDEMVHVELCSRMAMELGGAIPVQHDPRGLILDTDPNLPTLLRAADLVVRFYCVGEALSIPLLRGTWLSAKHPLARAVLGRIVRDEAAHGTFGWSFLDWAEPMLDAHAREILKKSAQLGIDSVYATWDDIRQRPRAAPAEAHALGWMASESYLALAEQSLKTRVVDPLRARGIMVDYRDPKGSSAISSLPTGGAPRASGATE